METQGDSHKYIEFNCRLPYVDFVQKQFYLSYNMMLSNAFCTLTEKNTMKFKGENGDNIIKEFDEVIDNLSAKEFLNILGIIKSEKESDNIELGKKILYGTKTIEEQEEKLFSDIQVNIGSQVNVINNTSKKWLDNYKSNLSNLINKLDSVDNNQRNYMYHKTIHILNREYKDINKKLSRANGIDFMIRPICVTSQEKPTITYEKSEGFHIWSLPIPSNESEYTWFAVENEHRVGLMNSNDEIVDGTINEAFQEKSLFDESQQIDPEKLISKYIADNEKSEDKIKQRMVDARSNMKELADNMKEQEKEETDIEPDKYLEEMKECSKE